MRPSFLRWCVAVILVHTGNQHGQTACGEPAHMTDGHHAVDLTPVVRQGLEQPVYLTHAGDGSTRLYAVEQPGRIRILKDGTLLSRSFLDITERVLAGSERGLLGLAFHPKYSRNGRFFVHYTRKADGATVVAEYHRGSTATSSSPEERILLTLPQPYPNHSGGNYGWRAMEGMHCFNPPTSCRTPQVTSPIFEYSHEKGRCSVIGGYVYRGRELPNLTGTYVYGDYCTGEIFTLPSSPKDSHGSPPRQLIKTSFKISSFGEDPTGELYVLDHNGGIYRLSAP